MYNDPIADSTLVACPDCDLVQRLPELSPGASARCPRCNLELERCRDDRRHLALPLALAAAILYVIANTTPMLGIEAVGHSATTTVVGGAQHLWQDGREVVAVLVLCTAVVAPAIQIALVLAICLTARLPRLPHWVGGMLRARPTAQTWSMIEVMMLGVLVALIKIAELATVIPGLAMYSLGGLVFLLAAIQANFDPHDAWERIEWADPSASARRAGSGRTGARS